MHTDLLSFTEWTSEQANALLKFAVALKNDPAILQKPLAGKSIVALFEKPSLRTRVSFDIGINKLGGHMVYVDSQGEPLVKREDPIDVGANISQWADGIVARVYSHSTLEGLAKGANVPVINALCDMYHPCQALADYITMFENLGSVQGKTLAYVGDGNNVTHSLLILGVLLGCHQVVITPKGHEIDSNIAKQVMNMASEHGVQFSISNHVDELTHADVIYADTWLSMGDNTPLDEIKAQFMPYQVNGELMQQCNASHVMHCQPAHRDLEITGALMDSEQSLLMQQAENRLHSQNAIMCYLLTELDITQF
ncbi:MAG: ornithine carbamoyltransferase [Glaciecola sp.]